MCRSILELLFSICQILFDLDHKNAKMPRVAYQKLQLCAVFYNCAIWPLISYFSQTAIVPSRWQEMHMQLKVLPCGCGRLVVYWCCGRLAAVNIFLPCGCGRLVLWTKVLKHAMSALPKCKYTVFTREQSLRPPDRSRCLLFTPLLLRRQLLQVTQIVSDKSHPVDTWCCGTGPKEFALPEGVWAQFWPWWASPQRKLGGHLRLWTHDMHALCTRFARLWGRGQLLICYASLVFQVTFARFIHKIAFPLTSTVLFACKSLHIQDTNTQICATHRQGALVLLILAWSWGGSNGEETSPVAELETCGGVQGIPFCSLWGSRPTSLWSELQTMLLSNRHVWNLA
jgi:hypothetical protein